VIIGNLDSKRLCTTDIFLGLARQMEGQKDRAVALLDELLDSHPPPVDLRKTRLLATCVYLHIISGDLAESEPYNRRFRTAVKGGNYPYAEAWSDYLPGLVHLYRYELDAANPLLRRSIEQRFVHHARAYEETAGFPHDAPHERILYQ
jgi:LuxR family maltose regulon positive regulatory protein